MSRPPCHTRQAQVTQEGSHGQREESEEARGQGGSSKGCHNPLTHQRLMVFDTQGPHRLPKGRKGSRVAPFLVWTVASLTRRASPRASAPSPVHRHGDSGQAVRRLGARLLRDRQAPSPKKPGRPSNKPLPNSVDRHGAAPSRLWSSRVFSPSPSGAKRSPFSPSLPGG